MKILLIDDNNQGIFSHKSGHFFPICEKGQGRPPPPPPLTPLVTRLYCQAKPSSVIFCHLLPSVYDLEIKIGKKLFQFALHYF